MIKKLDFFDFDGTLMDTFTPEEGKEIWKDKKGEEYPHKGWWGRKESLDVDVFNIQPIKPVYSEYRKSINDSESLTVLLTNRIPKLKDAVINVLSQHNITFDDYNLKSGKGNKVDRILEYLNKYPSVKEINIYDDREKELVEFRNFKLKYGWDYDINIYNINDGKILKENYVLDGIIMDEVKHLIKK